MMKKVRIGICYPNGRTIGKDTMACVDQLRSVSGQYGIEIELATCQVADIATGKNSMITNGEPITLGMKLPDYDYFFSLDDDIVFTPEQFVHILNIAEDRDCIASGVYEIRNRKGYSTCGIFTDFVGDCRDPFKLDVGGIIKCDWIGTGFCVVSKKILEKMLSITEKPWFYKPVLRYNDIIHSPGMDIGFCINARNYFNIVADFNCKVKHLTEVPMENQKQQINIPAALYSARKMVDNAIGIYEQIIDILAKENEELKRTKGESDVKPV